MANQFLTKLAGVQAPQSSFLTRLAGIEAPEERPGFFSRLGTQAQDRAADIGNFLLPGQPFDEASRAAESLPEAEGFGEKAADIIGHTLPDLGIGLGLGATGIGAAGAAGLGLAARTATGFGPTLARLGVESAVLAPLEYGTRPPGEATAITLAGPVAGAAIGKGLQLAGRGISSLLGRGGAEAGETLGKEIDLSDFVALRKLKAAQAAAEGGTEIAPRIGEIGEFTPREAVEEIIPPERIPLWRQAMLEAERQSQRRGAIQDVLRQDEPFSNLLHDRALERRFAQTKQNLRDAFATPIRGGGEEVDILSNELRKAVRGAKAKLPPRPPITRTEAEAAGGVPEVLFTTDEGSLLGARFIGDTAHVGMVQVPEALRGRGRATQLYEALGDEMARRGATQIKGNVVGPEEAIARLRGKAQARATLSKKLKLEAAMAEGRAPRLSDIVELGDDAAQKEALDSLSLGSRVIKDILDDERDMLEVFKSMQRMPPEGVRDIAEAAEGLAGDKAKNFLKRMKGKGACPI